MRTVTAFTVSALMLVGIAVAQEAAPATTQVDDSQAWFQSSSVLTQKSGEGIYNAVCASCHMPQGEGAVGAGAYPALAVNENLAGADYPIYLVVHGMGAMPPLGGVLDDQQIADVVNYIRTHFGNDYPEDPATAEMVANTR